MSAHNMGKLKISLIILAIIMAFMAEWAWAGCPRNTVAYWKLDEIGGTAFTDSVGTNDAVCAGTECPADSPGKIAGAKIFDGIDDAVNVPSGASFNWSIHDSFTIEFWMKTDAASTCAGNQVIIGRSDNSTPPYWRVECRDGGTAAFVLFDKSGVGYEILGSTDLTDGLWHHVAAVRDAVAGKIRLYTDGSKETPVSAVYSSGFDSSVPLNIGHLANNFYFQGTIDEMAISSSALSDAEIRSHYYVVRGYCDMCLTPVRIMPLGDSITDGYDDSLPDNTANYRVGYRQKLYLDLIANDYSVDFVGSLQAGFLAPPPSFDIYHEGHGGWRDDQIAANIYNWLVVNPAEVILLHIGTNGLAPDALDEEAILNEIDAYSEDTLVILARIINQNPYNATITQFNNNVQAMAEARIANGDKIIIVDMENGAGIDYSSDMSADGEHPNYSGYNKMAVVWENALSNVLPVCGEFAPFIFTTPITVATVGQPYTYDVEATGNPAPTYSLLTSPTGMSIDAVTGLIQWAPTAGQEGIHNVSIQAQNSYGEIDIQNFTINIGLLIIDDGDPGTSFTGTWSVSSGTNPYGADSLYSRDPVGTYSYEAALSGTHEVSLWWTTTGTRCSNVMVDIYDGATLLDTWQVDQQANGGQWNVLGTYVFSGTAKVTINSVGASCSTSADAARFVLQ